MHKNIFVIFFVPSKFYLFTKNRFYRLYAGNLWISQSFVLRFSICYMFWKEHCQTFRMMYVNSLFKQMKYKFLSHKPWKSDFFLIFFNFNHFLLHNETKKLIKLGYILKEHLFTNKLVYCFIELDENCGIYAIFS